MIDCGASPGSWSQIAAKETNSNGAIETDPVGLVVGIDKLQIYPIKVGRMIASHEMNLTVFLL